jgi:hypothetical protein
MAEKKACMVVWCYGGSPMQKKKLGCQFQPVASSSSSNFRSKNHDGPDQKNMVRLAHFLPCTQLLACTRSICHHGSPIELTHGSHRSICPYSMAQSTVKWLFLAHVLRRSTSNVSNFAYTHSPTTVTMRVEPFFYMIDVHTIALKQPVQPAWGIIRCV